MTVRGVAVKSLEDAFSRVWQRYEVVSSGDVSQLNSLRNDLVQLRGAVHAIRLQYEEVVSEESVTPRFGEASIESVVESQEAMSEEGSDSSE